MAKATLESGMESVMRLGTCPSQHLAARGRDPGVEEVVVGCLLNGPCGGVPVVQL